MEKWLYSIYKILCLTGIGRVVIGKSEYEVGRYLPFDDFGLGVNTIKLLLNNLCKALSVFIITLIVAFFDKKYFIVALVLAVAAYKDSFIKWKRKQEKTLLMQLSGYLNELRREFYRFNDVEEAFMAAFSAAGEELKLHLGLIEDELDGEGIPERYHVAVPNRFLFIFIAICQCGIRYGDSNNTFISNIDELQKNIDSDLLKWDREDFIFSAVFFSISFSLNNFYEGLRGGIT